MDEFKIGLLIYTHNRIDDARINMEIARATWSQHEFLESLVIIHSFNGLKEWWPEKYLENEIIYCNNTGHYTGAATLLDSGIELFKEKYSDITHVIVLAADTWILWPEYLEQVIRGMSSQKKVLATCGWGTAISETKFWKDVALDFFILDLKWVKERDFFPLKYQEYLDSYSEVFLLLNVTIYLELVLLLRFKQVLLKIINIPSENLFNSILNEHIYLMKEREPVNIYQPIFERKMHCPRIGLLSHHDAFTKQQVLKYYKTEFGQYGRKFQTASNLDYYNNGFSLTTYTKDGKTMKFN